MALTVRMGIHIRAPREFVFQHLLTPHHLARWFCNFAAFDPRGPAIGTKFRFGGDYAIVAADAPGWTAEILGGEVLKSVTFRWPLPDADTRVEWQVEDAAEGSVMRVVHSGLPREDGTSGTFQDAWRVCLGNLKSIAEARDDSLRPDSSPLREPRFKLDLLVGVPRPTAFAALTDPARLRAWADTGAPATVEPRVDGGYSLGWPAPGRIVAMGPPGLLAVSFPMAGHEPRATFRLEAKSEERSGLYFSFEGFSPEDAAAAFRMRGRWTALLVGLKSLLEAGEVGFTEPYAKQLERA
ncbi:MAG TPA: SRPBCC domain-containing protein [Thermoplasmata archaeon]